MVGRTHTSQTSQLFTCSLRMLANPYRSTLPDSPEESPSPRTDLLSQYDGAVDRPRRNSTPRGPNERFRRERERIHSGTSKRDLVKALISEEYESKQTRRVLYKAYDQFQHETKRATEAEGRALEAAQRYRSLNESKILAQHEAVRLKEELRLYKLQLENAQSEIHKAQNILRAVEEQRDDAEESAARSRDTARKLNEARLIEQAREEGRRLGFEEGIRRARDIGFDEGMGLGYDENRANTRRIAPRPIDMADDATTLDEDYDRVPTSSDTPPTPQAIRPPSPPPKDRATARSRKTSSVSSRHAGPSNLRQEAPTPAPLPLSPPQRPLSVHNQTPSPRHPDVQLPPDGWIPTADGSHFISMPPPHELERQPEPMSATTDAGSVRSRRQSSEASTGGVRTRDFAFDGAPRDTHDRRNSLDSQGSTNHSKASTAISQLDLISPPHTAAPRRYNLSAIPEDTSSQASPNVSNRSRSVSEFIPPLAAPDFAAALGRTEGDREMDSPAQLAAARMRDQRINQKMADELRYSDPKEVQEWRRSGAQQVNTL